MAFTSVSPVISTTLPFNIIANNTPAFTVNISLFFTGTLSFLNDILMPHL